MKPALARGCSTRMQVVSRLLTMPLILFCLALSACSPPSPEDAGALAGQGAGGDGGQTNADPPGDPPDPPPDDPGDPPVASPSGYLLLSAERLEQARQMVADGDPRWLAFKGQVDGHLGSSSIYDGSPGNRALAYLLSGEASYAEAAWGWVDEIMQSADVRADSYLHFGDLMRHAALVLNYCGEALGDNQRAALADYLDSWSRELWLDNQGSGWGLDDPGNNYHHAFLQGTAFAGYALREAGDPRGQELVDLVLDKLESPGGVLEYLETRLVGGGWLEGANYGERSKQRLYDTLAIVASMGGPNYFYDHPFVAESVRFAIYQLQPDRLSLHPEGDLARDSAMLVSPAEREYLLAAGFWLGSGTAANLARWYVDTVAPSFDVPAYRGLAFKDMLFGSSGSLQSPDTLPTAYLAEGTGWLNLRSGWGQDATSVTISAAPVIEQSHQHLDVGSFVISRGGWLALDASTLSDSGLDWSSCAHNGLCVPDAERRNGSVVGLTAFEDQDGVAYVAVDATEQYRHRPDGNVLPLMSEHTRELVYLRPGVLVVYDRVQPIDGASYEWRMHFPVAPTLAGSSWVVDQAGSTIALRPLIGEPAGVAIDEDLAGGASDAWRLVELPSDPNEGRFLNLVSVAAGTAVVDATHVSSAEMDGVALPDAVVMFSSRPLGAAPTLPLSYTVSGSQTRQHLIANIDQPVDVDVASTQGGKTITLSPGTTHSPSAEGTLRLPL